MIGDTGVLSSSSFTPSTSFPSVMLADGSIATVSSSGIDHLTKSLTPSPF